MLESRLRAIIRKTKRGNAYTDGSLNNAIKVFTDDILQFISIEILDDMPDSTLYSTYLAWETMAIKHQDPDQRIKHIKKGMKIILMPSLVDSEDELAETTNIVSLFSK